jgi:hypothetical protein
MSLNQMIDKSILYLISYLKKVLKYILQIKKKGALIDILDKK